jgi:hypothetical protein
MQLISDKQLALILDAIVGKKLFSRAQRKWGNIFSLMKSSQKNKNCCEFCIYPASLKKLFS